MAASGDSEFSDVVAQLLTKAGGLRRVRGAGRTGFDSGLWAALVEIGVLDVADVGTMTELADIARRLGGGLAPVPFVEVTVGRRLLARLGRPAPNGITTVALRPPESGQMTLLPAGAIADAALFRGDHELVLVAAPASRSVIPNLADLPLADWPSDDGTVLASGQEAAAAYECAVDEWRILTAALLVGLASTALDMAVNYAQARRQFGAEIGSYQSIQHALAEAAIELTGAELLAMEAAEAADLDPARRSVLAAMTFCFSSETGRRTAATAVHVHGGIGCMTEADVGLYYRRAAGWPLVLAAAEQELLRLGRLVTAGGWAP